MPVGWVNLLNLSERNYLRATAKNLIAFLVFKMIYLGADHAGWHLKEEIKKYLEELSKGYEDLGNTELDSQDDYPDFAFKVAEKTVKSNGLGILFCATGIGMCMAANKIRGVRAALVWDEFTATQAKEHNNANIICLAGKVLDPETAKKIVRTWLDTDFSREERHIRRIEKIESLANKQNYD